MLDHLAHSHAAGHVRESTVGPQGAAGTPIKAHPELGGEVGAFTKGRHLSHKARHEKKARNKSIRPKWVATCWHSIIE